MLRRTTKGLIRVLAGLIASLAVIVLVCAWVLSRGPVSLGLFEDHITRYLNTAFPAVEVAFEDTILTWAGWDRAIDIVVVNLRMASADGEIDLTVPNLAFSVSTEALMEGVAAPSRLELFGPTVSVRRETGGPVSPVLAGILSAGYFKDFLRELSAPPRADDPVGYLTSIIVTDADIVIEDRERGKVWIAPDVQIAMTREGDRLDGETSFMVNLGNLVADISIVASYDGQNDRIDAGISFGNVIPSELTASAPEVAALAALADIRLPLHGTVTIAASIDGDLDTIGFDVTGGSGDLVLPFGQGIDVSVETLQARGRFDAVNGVLEIVAFSASFPSDFALELPAPVHHAFPVRTMTASGRYGLDNETLTIDQLDIGTGSFDVQMSAEIERLVTAPRTKARIQIPAMSVRDLKSSWPESMLGDAHRWVTHNILSGRINDFGLDMEITANARGEIVADHADGAFSLASVALKYGELMPVITDITADVTFDQDRFDFNITSAQSAGMDITSAHVGLYDISTNVELADIGVSVSGGFDQAMALIDHEPLGLASDMGIDPGSVSGQADVNLSFKFPLRNDLRWEDVAVTAFAKTRNVGIPEGLFDLDVHDAQLYLSVDNDGMNVSGELLLHSFAGRLAWRRNFSPEAGIINEYDLSVEVSDVNDVTGLGIDVRPFSAGMIKGTFPLDIQITERDDGTADVHAVAVLDTTELSGPMFNWHKSAGERGLATVSLELADNKIAGIPGFLIETDDLLVSGRARYLKPGGDVSRIELDRISYGRTDMAGLLVPAGGDGAWDADFSGESLDLSPVWDEILRGDLLASDEPVLEDVNLSFRFDRLYLPEGRGVRDVAGVMSRADDVWRTLYLTSVIPGGETLEIKLTPSEEDARILTVWSLDAGSVLRTLGIYENMVGGELSLTGRFDDSRPSGPLSGQMDIRDYRILNAPSLAKILSLLALTGIVEALQGEGLLFGELVLPFTYQEGILDIDEARATGASLGFTASGRVYSQVDRMDMTGTIVPAYVLNSMLGNIPVVGTIFSGGEDGGGLFAANYSMAGPLEGPDISINPLSVLTPGFLRNIFNIGRYEDGGEDGDLPVPTEKGRQE